MDGLYILDGHTPVPVDDLGVWGAFMQRGDRHVAKDTIGDILVSTVFLGSDHRWGSGPPVLFETMVFGGDADTDQYCERYSTWDEATEGHRRIVASLTRDGRPPG